MNHIKKALNVIIVLTMVLTLGCTKEPNNSGGNNNGGSGSGHETTSGVLNGLFSVSDGLQVQFSIGNLQYKASSNTWKFADNQWDYIGENNQPLSSSYNGWIDLFGWGTSGWDCGNTYYHPWDSDNSDGSLYGPFGNINLTGSFANADWGVYNSISNGGNQTNLWRTLTLSEWKYIINTRNTSSGIRFAKAKVNGVNGLILFPDDWTSSYYSINSINQNGCNYSDNEISTTQWQTIEQQGAVFLPASGYRYGTSVYGVKSFGYYWSATCSNYDYGAYYLGFDDLFLSYYILEKYNGYSVRLVKNFSGSNNGNSGTPPIVVTADVTDVTSTTATCGGTVTDWGGTTVIERGLCWSTSTNPTINDYHIAAGSGAGSFSCEISSLEPGTTYNIRAYAVNSEGVGYGEQKSFTTQIVHDYVDLGLPSGLLWATCNIGANKPEDYGSYFAWGETNTKNKYTADNYKYYRKTTGYFGGEYKLIKYCTNSEYGYDGFVDNITQLLLSDDAATMNWDANWRIPTKAEWDELISHCLPTWTTQQGVKGLLFTASNGQTLFLPASGRYDSELHGIDNFGDYLSSKIRASDPSIVFGFSFLYNDYEVGNLGRYVGYSVRPVRSHDE